MSTDPQPVITTVVGTLANDSTTSQFTLLGMTTASEKVAPSVSPVNEIPTLSVASNVVGAIIFVLLLMVILLGLTVFLVVVFARRRIKRRQRDNIHQRG